MSNITILKRKGCKYPLYNKGVDSMQKWHLSPFDKVNKENLWFDYNTNKWLDYSKINRESNKKRVTNALIFKTIKALIRHLSNQNFLYKTTFNLSGKCVGEDFIVVVNKNKNE